MPSPDEIRAIFVEANILGEFIQLNVIDYIFANEVIKNCGVPREKIETLIYSVAFTRRMLYDPVFFLSGGWRMKLVFDRTMLQNADNLLLEEPTNHLNVVNVKGVEDYLNNLKNVASIVGSHDEGLLNNVYTRIIQIESSERKLHKDDLNDFVNKVQKAKYYFQVKKRS